MISAHFATQVIRTLNFDTETKRETLCHPITARTLFGECYDSIVWNVLKALFFGVGIEHERKEHPKRHECFKNQPVEPLNMLNTFI